jgi:hypothetical protein
MAGVLPLFLQLAPPEAVTAEGPVVYEDPIRVLKDLEVILMALLIRMSGLTWELKTRFFSCR